MVGDILDGEPLSVVTLGTAGSPLTEALLDVIGQRRDIVRHVVHIDPDGNGGTALDPNRSPDRDKLAALGAHVWISAGYSVILSSAALEIPKLGAINVHPSLLPAYRGSHPVYWAMFEGQSVGLTIHEMVPQVDSGDILTQLTLAVDPHQDPAEVYRGVCALARQALDALLGEIAELGALPTGTPQAGLASYRSTPARELDRLTVDWSQPAAEIVRRIRVFPDWVHFIADGERTYVSEAAVQAPPVAAVSPGTIVGRTVGSLRVAAGDGRTVEIRSPARRRSRFLPSRLRSLALGWRTRSVATPVARTNAP